MTANGLQPYPAYRDSGVDWLGDRAGALAGEASGEHRWHAGQQCG